MTQPSIDKLILNSPYDEPKHYWSYKTGEDEHVKEEGRRPAGYVVTDPRVGDPHDLGTFQEIALANAIRPRVAKWRKDDYPGISSITRKLLAHWQKTERREHRLFFCQLEAIETLIWLVEAPVKEKEGIEIPGDGGAFTRWCSKMATGSGKTVVMAMLLAWQLLNKAYTPWDPRFTKYALIVAPGLTVKNRLAVLVPDASDNYYAEFDLVPEEMMPRLRQGKVQVLNWHKLAWETAEKLKKKRSVDKRGVKSDEAYARDVLRDMVDARNFLVINDEAHHAWRVNLASPQRGRGVDRESVQEATIWVGGLDRLHRERGILYCFDMSATPFAPSGHKSNKEALFKWIVSDFGLNDAIESGLVKTPRVVVRDDSRRRDPQFRSHLYRLYHADGVHEDLSHQEQEFESEPLPELVMNAYQLLADDWQKTRNAWQKEVRKRRGPERIPVMISVANNVTTAARIKHAFVQDTILVPELCQADGLLHIDSKVLKEAEQAEGDLIHQAQHRASQPKEQAGRAEDLRTKVNTVGKRGEPGEFIRNIIAVGMLSEGWDAHTVTHIMGLRAFTSQLLCEQVVGRGLRRASYEVNEDGLLSPEYVNVFGVPFSFLPQEGDGKPPRRTVPKKPIKVDEEKAEYAISWPNILRLNATYYDTLRFKGDVSELILDPGDTITHAELKPIMEGRPAAAPIGLKDVDLKGIAKKYRLQTYLFRVVGDLYGEICDPKWCGIKTNLLAQIVGLAEEFIYSDKIQVRGDLFTLAWKKRVLILLSLDRVVRHIKDHIDKDSIQDYAPEYDKEKPIRSTANMPTWWTSKPCERGQKSHISHTVYDSKWEACEAFLLDKHDFVRSYAKTDHLGFYVTYEYRNAVRRYLPDYLVKLGDNSHLVLEVKGQIDEEAKVKRAALQKWVCAVNAEGRFGVWREAMVDSEQKVEDILGRYAKGAGKNQP